MQDFKASNELFKQDPTMEIFGLSIEKLHVRAAAASLHKNVPEEVQSYFNTARNLFVFSYYHYGFVPVSSFLALSAVEMAVRTVYPWAAEPDSEGKADKRSFRSLLERAAKDGRLHESRFPSFPEASAKYRAIMEEFARSEGLELRENPRPYHEIFVEVSAKLRNSFAHPSASHILITPEMAFPLIQRAAEAINQLFDVTDPG